MAIDTAIERRQVAGLGAWLLPVPDGSITVADRGALLHLYYVASDAATTSLVYGSVGGPDARGRELKTAVQGALRPSQVVTWYRTGETVEDLTGATLTGVIRNSAGVVRAIAGVLTVTDGEAGEFRWDYHADDVAAAGNFTVQFSAAFGSNPTPARTRKSKWMIHEAMTVAT